MRTLCASVLIMEALVTGFAMLVAKDLTQVHEFPATLIGSIIIVLAILAAGMLGKPRGIYLGSFVQILAILMGIAVTSMYFLGGVFALLWIAAIVIGRKYVR